MLMKQKKSYTLLYKDSAFWVQSQYAYGYSNFSLILSLQYAWNSKMYIKVGT